jgi:myo-inositol-1(or 4)-monophosphatase
MKSTLVQCVEEAGSILLRYFGRLNNPRLKGHSNSVVCDADLAAERHVLKLLKSRFPADGVIAEESGHTAGESEYTWVVDPLDGTSNFVAGIPWFGVQIGVLRAKQAVMAAMYLPVQRLLYFAEKGRGAQKNGKPVQVTPERRSRHVLCAFGFDPDAPAARLRQTVELMVKVAGQVRNVRATNSLVDFCLTVDGRLGGCLNLNTRVWDVVPVALILPEAGGRLTDVHGKRLDFALDGTACEHVYTVLGASPTLHRKLLCATRGA